MTVMDDYLESPIEPEDVFPCKGCGEILEEGKAFELAGNRWHLDCFRCNTCNTLLDSDANLLLLGDGSLICNNCTYSCSACGSKIEDLAILTGDQAFCATCFRCRNCKRKIDNLRYARTSQGIFCMSCHESLMARRRKKSKTAQTRPREKESSPMITEKSLPALPPNAIPPNAFSNDRVSPDSDTPTELSPRPRPSYSNISELPAQNNMRASRSPERHAEAAKELSLNMPAGNYRNNRNSQIVSGDLSTRDDDGFFIPVGLDPTPGPTATPRTTSDALAESGRKSKEKEYSSGGRANPFPDKRAESQSSTPHIAFQEKGRQPSSDYGTSPQESLTRKLSKRGASSKASTYPAGEGQLTNGRRESANDEFQLQDAPKSQKSGVSRGDSQVANFQENDISGRTGNRSQRSSDKEGNAYKSGAANGPASKASSRSSQDSHMRENQSRFSDDSGNSVNSAVSDQSTAKPFVRKDVPAGVSRNVNGKSTTGPLERVGYQDEIASPNRLAAPRPGLPDSKISDTYMQPRAPPQPPAQPQHIQKESVHSLNSAQSPKVSPKLPRWSAAGIGGDFSMDEDMARILGTDESSSSILRRVSNAVRHGRTSSVESGQGQGRFIGHSRSVSETTRDTMSPRWSRTPIAEDSKTGQGHDISGAAGLTGTLQDDPAFLKRQLRTSEQRVAELERQFEAEKDIRHLNKKLMEKRKTVADLDSQTEIMIRQLEVLAGYVERAKKTNEPLDPRELEDSAIKDFVQKLDKVKQTMLVQIEQLCEERDDLVDEKTQAVQARDRALMEFEQLSNKNAQLADMNNDLTSQLQERFRHNADIKSPNGLGIYSHSKGASTASVNLDASSVQTGSTMVANESEEPILEGPTVVNIRNPKGQVKKFNWKKGTSKVAHNFSKGINRAAVAFQQTEQPRGQGHQGLTGDSIGLPYNMTVAQVEAPVQVGPQNGQARAVQIDNSRQGFGFFSKNKATMPKSSSMANIGVPAPPSSSAPTAAEAPSTLFGSDLVERADYERRQIPSVVTRCIEEVELRGMDVEGIYRKTGGNSQVKMIQEGLDKTEDYDISDPGLDITAVTSVLKQYFRKLPNPLLTFDVYERVLESNGIQNENDRCGHLRRTVNMLPAKHRDCLEFLMFHLARVASRERENLMSPKNLAVVFAPTIMRDHSLEKEMTDMHAKNVAVQFIIENSHNIFGEA